MCPERESNPRPWQTSQYFVYISIHTYFYKNPVYKNPEAQIFSGSFKNFLRIILRLDHSTRTMHLWFHWFNKMRTNFETINRLRPILEDHASPRLNLSHVSAESFLCLATIFLLLLHSRIDPFSPLRRLGTTFFNPILLYSTVAENITNAILETKERSSSGTMSRADFTEQDLLR